MAVHGQTMSWIKIGDVLSEWAEMTAGMPQGSYLGPLTFIILIDSLKLAGLTHKYIDDTTLTEILRKSTASSMESIINDVVQQSSNDLKWAQHINAISSKAASRLYLLKQLRCSSASYEAC